MAAAGIRAILNFAPTALHLRAPVLVRNIDLAGEISMLTHRLTAADAASEARLMPMVCFGLSHHTAPVEVRERHAIFPGSRMVEALVALRDYSAVKEAVMLQTCGRLEIYAELDDYETGVTQLQVVPRQLRPWPGDAIVTIIDSYLYTLLGRQAIEHLFRVSTGLDSMLIGEAEILGQVKDAYIQAQHAKSLGKTLHRLFREALNAGKTARSQTRIGDESVSIATAAIDAAKARLGELGGVSVVVIGAGKMGRTAVRRLRDEGAEHLIVTNRTISRAQELIAEVGFGEAIEMPGLVDALAAADIVVTSTGASHFVVTREHVRNGDGAPSGSATLYHRYRRSARRRPGRARAFPAWPWSTSTA